MSGENTVESDSSHKQRINLGIKSDRVGGTQLQEYLQINHKNSRSKMSHEKNSNEIHKSKGSSSNTLHSYLKEIHSGEISN